MRVSVYWLLIVTKLNLPKKDDAGPGKKFHAVLFSERYIIENRFKMVNGF
jgi:hypothetical protein